MAVTEIHLWRVLAVADMSLMTAEVQGSQGEHSYGNFAHCTLRVTYCICLAAVRVTVFLPFQKIHRPATL